MNDLAKLKECKILELPELGQLSSDLLYENYSVEWKDNLLRPVSAWFLRNYLYLPFNLIAELTNYSNGHTAAASVLNAMENHGAQLNMSEEHGDLVCRLKSMSDTFYGTHGNVWLHNQSDELKGALLFMAAEACGYSDRYNKMNASWYAPTPKEENTLLNLHYILDELSYCEVYLNYNISKIK